MKLKWYSKLGYALQGSAVNIIQGFIGMFCMIYLTDIAGLEAGVVGTLIMAAKVFDGFDDVLMGSLIDRTRTKWGRAKPWLVGSALPVAILFVMLFSVPENIPATGQYAYVFVIYLMLMDFGFSTLQIAGNSLIAFMTKNQKDQVDTSILLYLLGMVTSLVIGLATVPMITAFGGGAVGYRTTVIIYAVVIVALLGITALTVKELPNEEPISEKKTALFANFRYLAINKFFWILVATQILFNLSIAGVSVYYATYVLGDAGVVGLFSLTMMVPMFIGTIAAGPVIKKYGLRLPSVICLIGGGAILLAAPFFAQNLVALLVITGVSNLMWGPWLASMNLFTVATGENIWLKHNIDAKATVFGTSSLGSKLGAAVPTAIVGWLLTWAGYVANAPTQSAEVHYTLIFTSFIMPAVFRIVLGILIVFMTVEKSNLALQKEKEKQ